MDLKLDVFSENQKIYDQVSKAILIKGDSLKVLKNIKSDSVDMIFADPPYFLSGDGITVQSGKMVSVKKGEWDKKRPIQEIHQFNLKWIKETQRILKNHGSIWISGSMHNIFSVGMALLESDFKIINNITWQKTNPPPNISRRAFTHSTENIIWAKKADKSSKHIFNYELMRQLNNNKQMKDVWTTNTVGKSQKVFGNHPTQKPIEILERIVLASTNEDAIVLDPFNGSGTTGVACMNHNRYYIGIEIEEQYLQLSKKRFQAIDKNLRLF